MTDSVKEERATRTPVHIASLSLEELKVKRTKCLRRLQKAESEGEDFRQLGGIYTLAAKQLSGEESKIQDELRKAETSGDSEAAIELARKLEETHALAERNRKTAEEKNLLADEADQTALKERALAGELSASIRQHMTQWDDWGV